MQRDPVSPWHLLAPIFNCFSDDIPTNAGLQLSVWQIIDLLHTWWCI